MQDNVVMMSVFAVLTNVQTLGEGEGRRWNCLPYSIQKVKWSYFRKNTSKLFFVPLIHISYITTILVYRVSQKFVPLITCDITLDRNYTSTWNLLKTFIALLSTYIRKVNIRHALLCLWSRSEAVAAWSGISHVALRAEFSSRLVWAVFSDPSWF